MKSEDRRALIRAIAISPLIVVSACSKIPFIGGDGQKETGDAPGSTGLVGSELVSPDSLPDGTILWRDNSYMIPVGAPDKDGCQAYRHWAPERMTPQVIYYRRADGEFSANKLEAVCDNSI